MNPTLEQLARYVAQELQRGVPEVALSASLRESGWTQDWISAAMNAARQRAMPVYESMSIPAVQAQTSTPSANPAAVVTKAVDPLPHHSTRPVATVPAQTRRQQITGRRDISSGSLATIRKVLLIFIAVLAAVVVGLSIYRTVNGIRHAAEQRVIRDANRREDLSVLLSNLSDYYVSHTSYPTLTQLNTASFLEKNGFSTDSVTDPKWSPDVEACTKNDKPILAGTTTPSCYTYEVTTATGGVCNNGTTKCDKVKVGIYLEVEKQPYTVIFNKNSQVDK